MPLTQLVFQLVFLKIRVTWRLFDAQVRLNVSLCIQSGAELRKHIPRRWSCHGTTRRPRRKRIQWGKWKNRSTCTDECRIGLQCDPGRAIGYSHLKLCTNWVTDTSNKFFLNPPHHGLGWPIFIQKLPDWCCSLVRHDPILPPGMNETEFISETRDDIRDWPFEKSWASRPRILSEWLLDPGNEEFTIHSVRRLIVAGESSIHDQLLEWVGF